MRRRQRCFLPPFRNRFVVSREKDVGNLPSFVFRRTRVVGVIQNPLGERILLGGLIVPQDAWNEADDGIRDHQGGEHAAR